jgi:hypothetical protein
MTLKPPRRTPVLPTALLRRDLPIVVCPGTTTGKLAMTSAFARDPSGSGNDEGQGAPTGQARHTDGDTSSPGALRPGPRRVAGDRSCRVAVRGDPPMHGQGRSPGAAAGFPPGLGHAERGASPGPHHQPAARAPQPGGTPATAGLYRWMRGATGSVPRRGDGPAGSVADSARLAGWGRLTILPGCPVRRPGWSRQAPSKRPHEPPPGALVLPAGFAMRVLPAQAQQRDDPGCRPARLARARGRHSACKRPRTTVRGRLWVAAVAGGQSPAPSDVKQAADGADDRG